MNRNFYPALFGAQVKYRFIKLLLLPFLLLALQGCKKDGKNTGIINLLKDTADAEVIVPPLPAQQAVVGTENLKAWNAWKVNQTSRFDWVIIGDSYTQGNYYTGILRDKLLTQGYLDGGPGYCSFSRYNAIQLGSIDASIDADQLSFVYDPLQWLARTDNSIGPCGYVTNGFANATINVHATVALNTATIVYERHPNAGNFRYRLNGGNWTTVNMDNGASDIAKVVVDVSGAGIDINLDIEPLAEGQNFCGVIGERAGNVLALHKVGISGATADLFAQNDLWKQSTQLLVPKGVMLMFGTNEMDGNVPPALMRVNMQNIINKIKAIQPAADIIIMCPVETSFENEDPRDYKLAAYGNMLASLALANKACYINHSLVFGHFSQASVDNGLMDEDRRHPGEKGKELMAETIFSALKK